VELLQAITVEILVYERLMKPVEKWNSASVVAIYSNLPELIMPYATL